MPLKLIEFLEQFTIGVFKIKPTHFEKKNWINKTKFFSSLKLNTTYETRRRSRFSWSLHFSCSKVQFVFLLTKNIK